MKRTYTSVILAGLMGLGLAACSSTDTTSSSMGSSSTSSMNSSAPGTTGNSTGVQAGVPGTAGQLDNAPLSNGNANR
ncbi:hypothetical protein [Massilia brevitalea]|uniref:hypothetical protein n=1 Tax=Massilia brevitalea TaxID=442526 RepID=UPI00273881C7|nr:hypothetical protein [Massilia brevitalea]